MDGWFQELCFSNWEKLELILCQTEKQEQQDYEDPLRSASLSSQTRRVKKKLKIKEDRNEPLSEPESDQLPSGTAAGGWRGHEASSSAVHKYTYNTTETQQIHL